MVDVPLNGLLARTPSTRGGPCCLVGDVDQLPRWARPGAGSDLIQQRALGRWPGLTEVLPGGTCRIITLYRSPSYAATSSSYSYAARG